MRRCSAWRRRPPIREAPAVTLSPAATVSDVDNQTLASAAVTITDFVTGDVLAFTNTSSTTFGNITAIYNAGVLTLTSAGSTATLAQWQAALDAVQVLLDQRQPDDFWHRHQPDDLVGGERRHPQQQHPDYHA